MFAFQSCVRSFCSFVFLAALVDIDYVSVFSEESFAAGSMNGSEQCIEIVLLNDFILDGNINFTVTLNSSDPDVLLGNSVTVVTLVDTEGNRAGEGEREEEGGRL